MKIAKIRKKKKLGKPRTFTAAKGYFATAKQNDHPGVRCNEAMLRRKKGTVHTSQNFFFFFRKFHIRASIV